MGTTASGSVCSETQCTVTSIFHFQDGHRSGGSGCICSGLVESDSICLPTFSDCREMSTDNLGGEGRESSNSGGVKHGTPLPLHMNISNPCLLPQSKVLLTNHQGDQHPLMVWGELTLIVWQVSGNPWRIKEFQRKQSILSVLLGDEGLRSPTLQLGDCGKAGTVRGISILFQHL